MSRYRVRLRGCLLPEWTVDAPSAKAALDLLAKAMGRPRRELEAEFLAESDRGFARRAGRSGKAASAPHNPERSAP